MKIMVAYDGTLQAKEALVYGIEKARKNSGEVVALHVFNAPLFADYDATIGARDEARAEATRFVEEAKAIIREKGTGVRVSLYSTEGNPEEEVINFAKAEKADILLCPPGFRSLIGIQRRADAASELAAEAAKRNLTALTVSSKN